MGFSVKVARDRCIVGRHEGEYYEVSLIESENE